MDHIPEPIEHWVLNHCWPPGFATLADTEYEIGTSAPYPSESLAPSFNPGRPFASPSNSDFGTVFSLKKPYYGKWNPEHLLRETHGNKPHFMDGYISIEDADSGLSDISKRLCISLQNTHQEIPDDYRFKDEQAFRKRLRRLKTSKSRKAVRYLLLDLLCPDVLFLLPHVGPSLPEIYNKLNDEMCEPWISIGQYQEFSRPQPDFYVGFGDGAFSRDQEKKIDYLSGNSGRFGGQYEILFPFLVCEVEDAGKPLTKAVERNIYSLTLAILPLVELFKGAKLEHEVNCEVLGFSIAFNDTSIESYAHYPVIQGEKIAVHVDKIFSFCIMPGQDQWRSYRFVKNIFETWAPMHLRRILDALERTNPDWSV